jgi:hypothetical protein
LKFEITSRLGLYDGVYPFDIHKRHIGIDSPPKQFTKDVKLADLACG